MAESSERWRAKPPFNPLHVIVPAVALVVVGLLVALGWLLVDRGHKPAPPPPVPTSHALSTLEAAGINALLERQRNGAHKSNGTVTVNGNRTITVAFSYTADGAAGVGTITAGGLQAEVLLDQNVTYMRAAPEFWTAVGVSAVAPTTTGWVIVGPDFLGGKLFTPAAVWTQKLAPTPDARIDGNKYQVGQATATVSATDIVSYTIDGVTMTVAPIEPVEVTNAAGPLIAERGDVLALTRGPNGWTIGPPPPAPEPTPTTTKSGHS